MKTKKNQGEAKSEEKGLKRFVNLSIFWDINQEYKVR